MASWKEGLGGDKSTGFEAAREAEPQTLESGGAPAEAVTRFENKTAVVGVIGLGYVGLPIAMEVARSGYRVAGFDIDAKKIDSLREGRSYIHHIPSGRVAELNGGGKFEATADYDRLGEPDALIICVPTPLDRHREPDMSAVDATADAISKTLRRGQLIVLESTTYPGTTEERLRPRLESGGLRAGEDFFLAYSPEREDPGRMDHTTRTIPKVIGGATPACLEAVKALYGNLFDQLVPVSSTQAAEFTKLLENIYRAVNIALVNEMKLLCQRMDIDIWEVIEASKTKPFGYKAFYPGPGLGGHCIPIDPFYLTWKAREYGFATRFIELAGEINTRMPEIVVERVVEVLSDRGVAVRGARVLVLGLAYKENVDDARESPALRICGLLRDWGIEVSYHDPFIPEYPQTRRGGLKLKSIPLSDENLRSCDAALILTAHGEVDYQRVADLAPVTIDTRNATRGVTRNRDKIVSA